MCRHSANLGDLQGRAAQSLLDITEECFYPFLNRFYQFLTTPQMHLVNIQCDNAPERALHLTGEEEEEAKETHPLCYMDIVSTKISITHKVWSSLESTVADVRKGISKSRMITGTYLLQSNKHKFSKATVCAAGKCCGLGDEDICY